MMFGNPISQALTSNQAQVLAQSYLDQARQQKTAQHPEWALALYDQAKVTFRYIADARHLVPPLSGMKSALVRARTPQTPEEDALRQRIAEVYFERAELLEKLGKPHKAQASRKKAQAWGYERVKSASIARAVSLSVLSAMAWAWTRTATLVSMPLQQQLVASRPLQRLPVASSAQEKSVLVDYLFEKALSTLGSLEVSDKPSLFLMYAHDNPAHGQAKASTSKYLIDKLSTIRVNLYSDQAPMAQPYSSSPEDLKEDGKLEDILTSQLCLLPDPLRDDVKPVDKVVVCCSEVLGNYLKWPDYQKFYHELQEAYRKDRAAYRQDGAQPGTSAIRQVVKEFSQEQAYKAGFHHVLTEIAFLQIRAEERGDQHGIIPVSLTPHSYEHCLAHFIPATTVRMEDILRFDEQAQAGREGYPNQSRHWVLFKLIERLLVGSDEAKTFLNKFWQGYSDFIYRLKNEPSTLGELEFAKLLDGIFDGIRAALHSQLAFTVQQQHQQLRVLHADPRAALKEQYFAALKQDKAFEETRQLYVEPRGKTGLDSQQAFPLLSTVKVFLQSDKQVLLLTGDSGAGKSTFNRILEKQLWEERKEADPIPLFISLPSIDKPEQDLIGKALKKRGLSELQIQKLKKEKQKFIFILDGYDEIRQTQNLYLSNQINQSDSWLGQMVISCRTEYLGQHYQSRFRPNPHLQEKDTFFEEVAIEPFSTEERDAYLEKYVAHHPTGWTVQQYQEALEQPHVKDLASNPFLLRVTLDALPYLANEGEARTTIQLRLDLYDQFVRQWFERNEQRLSTQHLTESKRETFRALSEDDFAEHGLEFVQDLAVHLYTENEGSPIIEYSLRKDEGNWKDAFFGVKDKQQLLREAWPLMRSGNQYRFIHKSLLEYLAARALFDSFDACLAPKTLSRRGSDVSIYSFDHTPASVRRTGAVLLPLVPKHWLSDLSVVRLLADRVQQEPAFKAQLLAIIELSKTDKAARQAAANAITILVRAGVQFNGADLNKIQIPGADLSFGVFDSAQLQGADLRKVNLRASWLRQANLSGAQMAGVRFGEWPFLQEDSPVTTCVYSPDGKTCAVGLQSGSISVYETSSWKKVHTLSGHTGDVRRVVYSPNGQQIASGSVNRTGSEDHAVRLWDAQTGQLSHTLRGHTSYVNSVVYSPNGQQIASSSSDQTVCLWDAQTGQLSHTLSGHTREVWSVVYSPNGQQIASGSNDHTVRLWDAQTGQLSHTLSGHTRSVNSVVYSPNGQQIASGCEDNTVRLWDAQTGQLGHTLSGHTDDVRSVVYSPNGQQIASKSRDKTVRLWDAQTGQLSHSLSGHTDYVSSVVYSPNGQQIASGSLDETVRLWDAQTGTLSHTLSGHTRSVSSVAYSPNGQQIASGSDDKTVRLWDAQTGQLSYFLSGHNGFVWSVVYSPNGQQIASGSNDHTVRLWDAQTGKLSRTLSGHNGFVWRAVYSPNGQQIASGSNDHTVRLWDAQTGQLSHTLSGHTDNVWSVVYSPNGQQIASCSSDQTVRLWDAQTGQLSHTLSGHTRYVNSVVYSPNGQQIASGSNDHTVCLWDAQTGQRSYFLRGHNGFVLSVVYSPNGQQIASGSLDNTVRLWDAQTGKLSHTLSGHTNSVRSVVYSPSGQQIASGSDDHTVRLWDAQTGQLSRTLSGHADDVKSVVYSPNGQQIASGSDDRTVRLWNATSGQCDAVIRDFNGPVNSLVWKATPDDNYLVTGCADKSVRQWQVIKEGKEYKVVLCWSSTHDVLTVTDTSIEGVQGLSHINERLLKQRGAVGELEADRKSN